MDPRRTARAPAGPPKREGGAVGGTGAAAGAAAGSAAGLAAGARRLPSGVPGLQGEIDQLGRDIQQLRIDFERFFSGALPWPPDELRGRIKGELRGLRNSSQATAVDRFRLGDMEARFNSYNELYNRRLRDVEEGRQRVALPPPAETPRFDPHRGIVVGSRLDPAAVEALYDGLASGKAEAPRFDLASFGDYLERQASAIRERTGCSAVQFRLAEEDGKLKLKARPLAGFPGPR